MNHKTNRNRFVLSLLTLGLMLHGIFALPAWLASGGLIVSGDDLLNSPQFICSVDLGDSAPSESDEHDCSHCELCGAQHAALLPQPIRAQSASLLLFGLSFAPAPQRLAAHGLRANDRGPPRV